MNMHAKINPDISSGINPDISSTIKKEWQFIKKDFWLKALLFWLPIVLAFTLWAIFSVGIARNLAIGVVDLDNSVMSRGLTRYYDASPSLSVTKHYSTAEQGSVALRNGSIYGLVIIPFELEKNTVLGKSPQVTVFYNSQYILIGKLINAAVVQAHGTYIATIEVFKSLAKNQGQVEEAIGDALPISSQITPLFNSNSHYGQFLVAAAVPAVWQILIIATVVLSFGIYQRNNNNNNKNNWLMAINKQTIVAKLIPYIIIFWLQGIIFISVFYGVMNWPMHGNWFLLVFAQLLLVIACVSVATLFFFITLDVTRAMSFVAVFAAPAFAFMGVTFPTSDMPLLAQLWRDLLPISYYIEIQIQQVNYGTEFIDSSGNYLMLMAFSSCFYVAILLMNKKKSTLLHQTTNVNKAIPQLTSTPTVIPRVRDVNNDMD